VRTVSFIHEVPSGKINETAMALPNRLLRIAVVLLVIVLAVMLATRKAHSNGQRSITVDGRKRTYELHLPHPYDSSRPAPLVLVLHGRLGDGHGTAGLTHFDKVSDAHGFLVVYPDGLQRSWADGRGFTSSDKNGIDDGTFMSALIDKLSSDNKIDAKRVYVTGISNGGFMSQRLGCELSSKIAAVGTVAATLSQNTAASCRPARPVSVAFLQGTKDPLVPIQGGPMGRNGSHGVILSLADSAKKWSHPRRLRTETRSA